ncbi:hypothetical protein [uncultured Chitinophaga sp.]|uniref:hypothetical protein n=1 Tax=uncultured Chitinophaga sp. TaxID=339340 RepID=UPI0025DDEE1F|nr:hypothetical protein [uncultured Chitinophaga sp.]
MEQDVADAPFRAFEKTRQALAAAGYSTGSFGANANTSAYDKKVAASRTEALNLKAGYNADGSQSLIQKVGNNKTWKKFEANIAMPMIEGAALEVGGGLVARGLGLGGKAAVEVAEETVSSSRVWEVGAYNKLAGVESGLDAHHVGQKALMKNFIPSYDMKTAPAILVPEVGHTTKGAFGIVSRSTKGFTNARQVLARDIFELRRVYKADGIPNSSLQQLIDLNKTKYPGAF